MDASVTPRPAPTRARPFEKTQGRTPLWLRLWLGRDLAPSREEFQAALDGLWVGDLAMDELVAWMEEYGRGRGHKLFQQALKQGVDSLTDAPEPLVRFFRRVENRPDWVDPELLELGARFIHGTGEGATFVLRDLALMGGYLLSGFNQSLVLTGALTEGTGRRVARTGHWWIDCTEVGGLEPLAAGYRATLQVRLVHALVRRDLDRREDWDHERWGLPLSQVDMVATYLGFSVVMLNGLRLLGIPVTPTESRAVMHLWRYACWLMGVQEQWLVDTEKEGALRLHHTLMTQSQPDWTTPELARALAREPLAHRFPRLQSVRRRLRYHMHLSTSRYFLGKEKMRQLGLPEHILPWFPLMTIAPRFTYYSSHRFLPGLRERLQQRGRAFQKAAVGTLRES